MAFFTTPKGSAGYMHVFSPDEYKGQSKYKAQLTITEEAAAPLIEQIEEERLELGKKAKTALGNPYKKNEDGTLTFKFASQKPPKVVDSKGHLINDEFRIGGGSTIQVRGSFKAYEGFGGGVSAYLNEVRIVKLVESSADWGTDDEDEDDAYVASPSSPKPSNNLEGAEADQEEDEDVNF
jgi:hypothetical protein